MILTLGMAWKIDSTWPPLRREGFDSGETSAISQILLATAALTRQNSEVSIPRRCRERVSFIMRSRIPSSTPSG